MAKAYLVRNPYMPPYSAVRSYLTAFAGEKRSAVLRMYQEIYLQTGTPQKPVDWSDPDTWIPERLHGESRRLAGQLWEKSGRTLNPRHVYGTHLLVGTYKLMADAAGAGAEPSDRGRRFLDGDPEVVKLIDEGEGMGKLLSIVSGFSEAKRSDLLPQWSQYLLDVSKFASTSTFLGTLRMRLLNLLERKLIDRNGNYYRITDAGRAYLATFPAETIDPSVEVMNAISAYNAAGRAKLREKLAVMNPYLFEELISDLLEAMGYEDVTVTRQSGDLGVDVVAKVQFGITTITEVVQVKRQKGSIGRPVLDQLRGSLPYFNAIRGTIITLGTVSTGCKDAALFQGAAPIGLIDGEKLLDLLTEHSIGMRRRPVALFEVDEERFRVAAIEEPEEPGVGEEEIRVEEVMP